MEYRKIGKWGLKVSEIGLGSWLTFGGSVDEKVSIEIIHAAFARGINFIDTANVYAFGQAEVVVGKALSAMKRDEIVLASKVFFPMGNGPNDKGLSRKHVYEQCHASLRRLGTDYIDLYQCHRHDPDVPMEELVRTMDDLIRQGKILYWGVSEWSASQIEEAVRTAHRMNACPPISNQPCYNMFDRTMEQEVLPASERLGLGQVVFSPLAQGVLSGKYKPGQTPPEGSRGADNHNNMFMINRGLMSDRSLKVVERLSAIGKEQDLTTAQLALAWCLRLSGVSSAIVGATRISQLDDNVKASGVRLNDQVLKRIEDVLMPLGSPS